MKNNKGITLIALVITIIVLLILAGVSIAMLTGENGILTKSSKAAADTLVAEAKERATVDIAAQYADYLDNKYENSAASNSGFTPTNKEVAKQYSISGTSISIVPKTSDGKTVSGTVSDKGVITWSET